MQGAQLYIQVLDSDSITPDDLIVRYRFDLSLSVGMTTTFRTSNTEPAITFKVIVLCAPFYIGSSCDIFNHCESNAVTCNERGACVNGFTSFTCNCNPQYFGANCERQTFASKKIAIGEEHVIMVLIPTPVYAMLVILVLIVRMILMIVRGRAAVKMVCVWMRSTLTPVSAMLATLHGADCEVDIDECLLMERVCSGHGNCSHGIASSPAHVILATLDRDVRMTLMIV